LVAQLLINRGVTSAAGAKTFLDAKLTSLHEPTTLPGVTEAAERIAAAVLEDRKIIIYGDYDVDGVCGTSLLWSCLKLAGAKHVDYYIPHRVEEGYGLNADALEMLVKEQGAELIVTVDCGISAVKEAARAKALGVELIITDHHHIGHELPAADVLVHPRLPGSEYPFGELCGCGVAFKLAWQVCKSFGDGKKASPHLREFLLKSLSFVALATIADIVPLEDENRMLVKHGLANMVHDPSVGLQALLRVAGVDTRRGINAGQVGFKIGPRINAAGRLERAMLAVELLTTDDAAHADDIAEQLNEHNTRRQETERAIVAEAHAMIHEQGGLGDRAGLVLGKEGWHPGVIGIVASRIVEAYHRPTIVIALGDEISQGSARSVPGFNLYEAIEACSSDLITFGGHAAAAGLKIDKANFQAFAERFDQHCRTVLTAEQKERVLQIDAEVPLAMLTLRAIEDIDRMQPFGMGNPQPVISISNVRVLAPPRFVGEGGKTVQVRFGQERCEVKGVAFNQAERWKKVEEGMICSVVGTPSINEYNGRRDVQLMIKDFRFDEEA
jgi:single-stranded-DNA-specific exonuclease